MCRNNQKLCQEVFGKEIYIRGLLEISNICKSCYYCGTAKATKGGEIPSDGRRNSGGVHAGYALGFRTFVLQGGEDMWYDDDRLCHLVSATEKIIPTAPLPFP